MGTGESTSKDNSQQPVVDRTSRVLSLGALFISVVSAVAASFSAYNSARTAQSSIAQARPVLNLSVPGSIKVGDEMTIPLQIVNGGRTRAAVKSIRLVIWRNGSGAAKYVEWPIGGNVVPLTTPVIYELRVRRFQQVDGSTVDISRGRDAERRLDVEIVYRGLELDSEFEETLMLPVSWMD